jgi:hypothetical protein
MRWAGKLNKPIELRDGRRLEALGDAVDLILALPVDRQRIPHWKRTAALLLDAGHGRDWVMADIDAQLAVALRAEGLI